MRVRYRITIDHQIMMEVKIRAECGRVFVDSKQVFDTVHVYASAVQSLELLHCFIAKINLNSSIFS